MLFYAASCGLGVAAGLAFAVLWLRAVPRGINQRFWSAMSALTRSMLRVDETSEFFRLYRRLARLLAGYVARNLWGTALACLPVIAILLTVAPWLFAAWDERAAGARLVPEHAAAVVADWKSSLSGADAGQRTGYCATPGHCALFTLLAFNVVELDAAPPDFSYAVVRAHHGDVNHLWPFLNDLEAAFFAAFVVSTLAGLLWPRAKRY